VSSLAAGAPAGDLTLLPRASFGDRVAAGIIDVIIVLSVVGLIGWTGPDGPGAAGAVLIGYLILFWAWKGTTLGGIVCHLRVVRADGRALEPGDAVVRALASLLSILPLGLGFLWMQRDPERQTWHDRIAGTYVVKVPSHWPVP
jgi:uncharacterized RDD family membrane protein YckC